MYYRCQSEVLVFYRCNVYLIVKIIQTGEIEVIARNWMIGARKCHFPKMGARLNDSALRNRQQPDQTNNWEKYNCIIFTGSRKKTFKSSQNTVIKKTNI